MRSSERTLFAVSIGVAAAATTILLLLRARKAPREIKVRMIE